jgi:hypothetical protein
MGLSGVGALKSLVTVPALERLGVPVLMIQQFAPRDKSGKQNVKTACKNEKAYWLML